MEIENLYFDQANIHLTFIDLILIQQFKLIDINNEK